jgi:Uri superfamily endonuclease
MRMDIPLPSDPGTYALILELLQEATIQVGALGRFNFQAGCFGYVGSAHGPGGLRARIRRHLRPAEQKRSHWHVDYLVRASRPREAWWTTGRERWECRWAKALSNSGDRFPEGFGASDCGCMGHLVFFESGLDLGEIHSQLERAIGMDLGRCRF